jgi:2-keto-4-pentenoate hydratase/2-oxohepta-3-ene-1,7-dioic acid hydratase in catechol pathway
MKIVTFYHTLEPGTGAPPGVGFPRKLPGYLKEEDVAEVEFEYLGILLNPVATV